MNVAVMMMLGAGLGFGLVLVAVSLRPSAQPIGDVFDVVTTPGQAFHQEGGDAEFSPTDVLLRLGTAITLATNDETQLRRDLAVTGVSLEQHALVKAAAPSGVILVLYMLWAITSALGGSISIVGVTMAALALASAAFVMPDIRLRTSARARRTGFRHALSAYLDLVAIIMSGGGGLLTALQTAAEAGDGWAFAEMRAALDRARLSNRTPWSQLGVLADRFDISELRDLVSSAELAGSEGSRIVDSISTKADVLRARLQAEVEKTAESLTEQMLLPVGLLLVALFLFLGFAVFTQLGGNGGLLLDEQAVGMLKLSIGTFIVR